MDAHTLAGRDSWVLDGAPLARRIARSAVDCLILAAWLGALFVGARRAGGMLGEPLASLALLMVAGALAVVAILFRQRCQPLACDVQPRVALALWAIPSALLLVWALGLLPGASTGGWLGFLGLTVAEEIWSWRRFSRPPVRGAAVRPAAPQVDLASAMAAPSSVLAELDETHEETDEGVLQRIVRRRDPDVGEVIEGWLVVELLPGQRQASAHLAICPPLDCTPTCYAEPADGPPCEVKIAQVLPYGVRFDVKLDQPADAPSTVAIELSVQEKAAE